MTLTGAAPELRYRLGEELAKAATATLNAVHGGMGLRDLAKLRALRLELASLCLEIPEESLQGAWIPLKELRTAILGMALFDMPRIASENELLNRIRSIMSGGHFGNPVTSAVVAGMLMTNAYELPLLTDFEHCPAWLLDSYLEFLFESPNIFQRPGDVFRYGEFLEALLTKLWSAVEQAEVSALQKHVLVRFLQWSNFVQANFLDCNVRDLFALRARLLESTLELAGYQLAHIFRRRITVPDRIRVGILTEGFAPGTETFHNLAYFEHLDRSVFEVNLYVFQETRHPLEEYCRKCSDRFVVLPKNDLTSQVARIRSDDLDIILIANNVTVRSNQPALAGAHRLARVQVALVDSPVTTGFRNMDVMLSAEWNEPLSGAQEQYTERLCQVDGSINCYAYEHDRDVATVRITRADLKCDSSSVLYFSGANCYKIIPELSETWAKILATVPDSVLVLMPFNPNWSSSYSRQPFIDRIEAQLAAYGVGPGRLRVIGCVPTRADVHNVMKLCDVYLDSYPFAGACSFLDAVAVGLPAVAWHGTTARTRHGVSILRAMGLSNLAAMTEDEYIHKAVEFGTRPELREQARASIAAATRHTPPVLDTRDFGARVGHALHLEFENYVREASQVMQAGGDAFSKNANSIQISGKTRASQMLTDHQITEHLIQPYLRGLRGGEPGHVVDVGACYGQISSTFLRDGWTADLFEPDAGAREVLKRHLAPVAAQYRLFPFAVSDHAKASVQFYKASQHGLSGLDPTAYGPVEEINTVRCVRLGEFLVEQGVQQIDFLKVDTEGWDFEVLAGHDFERLRPTIVFVEYGAERQRPKLIPVLEDMRLRGYYALLFHFTDDGNFQRGIWQTRLLSVLPGDRADELPPDAFGNILFYPSNELLFPVAFADLFKSFAS
jgi:FkbM family methyltransferase